MSLPVLIGFAGVLVAAVATGLLAGRCVRQPRMDFILWTAATLALTVALAAQSMGFDTGFNSTTFRAIQLFALLLAPLWLAWGLVELVAANAVRFGMRLVASALTVVASVILATDPLTSQPFSRAWPLTGPHLQPVSHYALDAVQVVAVAAVLVSAILASVQAGKNPSWRRALPGVVLIGLAVLITAGLRIPLPAGAAYPLLSMLAAVFVWFGATQVQNLPGRVSQVGRARGDRRSGPQDVPPGGAHDRGRDDFWPGDYGPKGDNYAAFGSRSPQGPSGLRPGDRRGAGTRAPGGDLGGDGPARQVSGDGPGRRANLSGPTRVSGGPDRFGGSAPGEPPAGERPPATPAGQPPGAETAALAGTEAGQGAQAAAAAQAAPAARPYGRLQIFTLLDDRIDDFDRLAEQAAEEVRTGEPDTLVYVIHLVPNAPLQRIFYEIYRDRAAFDHHESQPYTQRFAAERRSCVLATNVIELRLKYAKVAPLPVPQAGTPAPGADAGSPLALAAGGPQPATRAPLPAGSPQRLPPLPSGPPQEARMPYGPQGSQRPQPLPPTRPQRPDRRSDQPRYRAQQPDPRQADPRQADPRQADQQRPDRRQLPSTGRRYGGG